MSARGVLRIGQDGVLMFRCPGCEEVHSIKVGEGPGPRWGFNADYDRPTFTPSIKVTGRQIERDADGKWTGGWICGEDGKALPCICHSFVRNGEIQFLGDCTHALAGRTVPLEPF